MSLLYMGEFALLSHRQSRLALPRSPTFVVLVYRVPLS
jgi:hypothetical protein